MKKFYFETKIKKKIVFFYEDMVEKQLLQPVYEKFKKKNYSVQFSKNFLKKTDIGYFVTPSTTIKKHSAKLSIISIGGMDQGKLFWPNFWLKEPWNNFDVGLLPGKHWVNMWQKSSWFAPSRPKYLMAEVGWPKTQKFINKINSKKKTNRIFTVLYAPCFETDKKGQAVVDAIKKTNAKLLIKHLPWNTPAEVIRFSDVKKNITNMTTYAKKNLGNRVKILNSSGDIFNYFGLADLLITDESSVMYESLLFNVPSLSCKDWPMRTNNSNKPRKIKMDKNVCHYTNKSNLQKTINDIQNNYAKYQKNTFKKKNQHFSNLTTSNDEIFKLINNIVEKKNSTHYLRPKFKVNKCKSFFTKFLNY